MPTIRIIPPASEPVALADARAQCRIAADDTAEDALLGVYIQAAREAAEQTERFDAPEIFEATPLPKALDGWDAERPLIYADESGDEDDKAWGGDAGRARPIGEAISPKADKLALLIGPEGGFTPEERRMLRALPYVIPVSLGPRILRAETAVIAALSIIQSVWGDWRGA